MYTHDPKQSHRVNGVLIVLSIILVGGLLWYMIASSGDSYTATPTDTTVGVVAGGEELYKNDEHGFSVRYDTSIEITQPESNDTWRFGSSTNGERIISFKIPSSFQANTNLSEALVVIGASIDQEVVTTCTVASANETSVTSPSTQPFSVFTSTDAGAGNFYEVTSYRMVKNNICYAIEQMIHSTNIEAYGEDQNIREFDRAEVENLLDRVVASFRFYR